MPLMTREEALATVERHIATHDDYIAEGEEGLARLVAGDHDHAVDAMHIEEAIAVVRHELGFLRDQKAYLERMHRLITEHWAPGQMVDTGEALSEGVG